MVFFIMFYNDIYLLIVLACDRASNLLSLHFEMLASKPRFSMCSIISRIPIRSGSKVNFAEFVVKATEALKTPGFFNRFDSIALTQLVHDIPPI